MLPDPQDDLPPDDLTDHYDYILPEEKIAVRPLKERDQSRLLVVDQNKISHRMFSDLPELIPPGALFMVNESLVIQARMYFKKKSGGKVEILLLEPSDSNLNPSDGLREKGFSEWKIWVRGKARVGDEWDAPGVKIQIIEVLKQGYRARFSWDRERDFYSLIQEIGHVPLPPYLKRKDTLEDRERYQSIFAKHSGSVAAPTASLHFSAQINSRLIERGGQFQSVTLHVGAGTFKPVQVKNLRDHAMHEEKIEISRQTLEVLLKFYQEREKGPASSPLISVGTTTLRTLESAILYGMYLVKNPMVESEEIPLIPKNAAREWQLDISSASAIEAILSQLSQETWKARTQLFIQPGSKFYSSDVLLTNFHQPRSTLFVLISAWLGHDKAKQVYEEALQKNYRFLSYGDACLFFRSSPKN